MKSLAFCFLVLPLWTLSAAQPDPISEKLKAAKAAFQSDFGKYKKVVDEYFDRRDQAARNALDKKLVAQIKLERDAFEERGDLPKDVENLVALGREAQKPLDDAYQDGAKAYFKAKMDKEADATEKELIDLLLKSKRANYVADLKFTKAKSIKDIGIGKAPIAIKEVAYDLAVIMHPDRGVPTEATYALGKGYTTFRAKYAVKRPSSEDAKGPKSPATFEVLANGKSIWKSKPVAVYDEVQECTVELKGLENVTLRVSCSGNHNGCHAFWLDPLFIR